MAEQYKNPLASLGSFGGLSGNALKGARIGGPKSAARGSASGNVSVGAFNVTPWAGKSNTTIQWQSVAIAGAIMVTLAVIVIVAKK